MILHLWHVQLLSLVVITALAQGAEIRLENALDGSGEITLGPGEMGVVNIVLETSNIDTIEVGTISILFEATDADIEVYAVSAGQSPPWEYDRDDFTLPCSIGASTNDYELDMESDDGFPFGSNIWILDSLTLINKGEDETPCDLLVTFGVESRAPELVSPDDEDFEVAPDCFAPGVPNTLYMGAGNPGPECAIPFVVHKGVVIPDCNDNGVCDNGDIENGTSVDCNGNFKPDECDLDDGTSHDCDMDQIPDECGDDCNGNGIADSCDLADGTSEDCTFNGIPDECEADCNDNGQADTCDIDQTISLDCNTNGVPDECDISTGTSEDCNETLVPDECELVGNDCDANGIPDECAVDDCNANGIPDACDLQSGTSEDCNGNSRPDECDIADCSASDLNCKDCNGNAVPDACDIDSGTSGDINGNSIPDDCEEACLDNDDCADGAECTIDLCASSLTCVHIDDLCPCEGDVNGDGVVDPLDSGFVLSRFGCPVGTGDPDCDTADQNDDAVVDPLDVGFVVARFGDCE